MGLVWNLARLVSSASALAYNNNLFLFLSHLQKLDFSHHSVLSDGKWKYIKSNLETQERQTMQNINFLIRDVEWMLYVACAASWSFIHTCVQAQPSHLSEDTGRVLPRDRWRMSRPPHHVWGHLQTCYHLETKTTSATQSLTTSVEHLSNFLNKYNTIFKHGVHRETVIYTPRGLDH